MKTAIKVLTVIFFTLGISFVVAYQSGYFKEPEKVVRQQVDNQKLRSQREFDSIYKSTSEKVKDPGMPAPVKVAEESPSPEESEEAREKKEFRMYSSKTIILNDRLNSTRYRFRAFWKSMDSALKKLVNALYKTKRSGANNTQ